MYVCAHGGGGECFVFVNKKEKFVVGGAVCQTVSQMFVSCTQALTVYTVDVAAIAEKYSVPSNVLECALFLRFCDPHTIPGPVFNQYQQYLASHRDYNTETIGHALIALSSQRRAIPVPTSWQDGAAEEDLKLTISGGAPRFVPLQRLASPNEAAATAVTAANGPYMKVLTQVFGDRAVVVDASGTSSLFGESFAPGTTGALKEAVGSVFAVDRAEHCFGVYLARLQARQHLIQRATSLLQAVGPDARGPAETLLAEWLECREDATASRELADKIVHAAMHQQTLSDAWKDLLLHREYLPKLSKWVVGGDAWACDIGYSGIHHIIASGEDINVLVLDTNDYLAPSVEARTKGRTKKDIGLYAMNYGGVYVASIALGASHTQTVRALTEADRFRGPSVIVAYAGTQRKVTEAIQAGVWPLYRWNPALPSPFSLDSHKTRADLEAFLKRSSQLSMLVNPKAQLSSALHDSAHHEVQRKHAALLHDKHNAAGSANAASIEQLNLLILFGSDSGNGAAVAERLGKKAEQRGQREVRCMEANEFVIGDLSKETVVLLIMSTAGQGEVCGNAKDFWTALTKNKASLKQLSFAVFGLGDSAYWGEGTADSAKYFCKIARDMDAVLAAQGATRLAEVGLGDDQDADGYEGLLHPWLEQVFDKLGIKALGNEQPAGGAGVAMVDEEVKRDSGFLRGHIQRGLSDRSTAALLPEDTKLTKFHGIYQQDDRDLRDQLSKEGKERAYSFMVRVGIPGGVCTPAQYLTMDRLSESHANNTLKLTTRQAFQLHGVLKWNLKESIAEVNRALMDTLAACGDVCRNVMANPLPYQVEVHAEVLDFARRLSAHLKPQTTAYHEIWLDKEQVAGGANVDIEPLYGDSYLPRKFKVGLVLS